MKKVFLLLVLAGAMPSTLMAQDDDLYFVPKKQVATSDSYQDKVSEKPTCYSGCNRDVDEYNRRGKYWSHYQKIGTDASGNDVIEFKKGTGVYPDSAYIDTTFVGKYFDTMVDEDDYEYSRRMSRWDGFYDPWFYSSRWGWPYRYGWYDPWYSPYYAGWYGWGSPWYDPWFYSGWYDPWYYGGWYGYYGWGGYPYWGGYRHYWGGYYPYYGGVYAGTGRTYGTRTWSSPIRYNSQTGTYVARTGNGGTRTSTYRSAGNRRFGYSTRNTDNSVRSYDSRAFGGTRSTNTFTPSQSTGSGFGGSHSGSFGGGSFGGGSRSGGGFGGGGNGGRFGGHR